MRRKVTCQLAGLLVWALAAGAAASESSQAAVSQGISALNDGRIEASVLLFTRALEEDPQDAEALYYRGLARIRLEKYASAVDDLARALELRPAMQAARMGLGYAQYSAGHYPAAELHLGQVSRESPVAGKARFYLGMSRIRSDQFEAAGAAFAEAAELDGSLATSARYYYGVAALRAGERDKARASFQAIADARDKPALANTARAQLEKMDAGEERSYRFYGFAGFEYDSNIVLISNDNDLGDAELDAIGVSDEKDGRSVLSVGATYMPYRGEAFDVTLGYDFFQSLHFTLTDFDLQTHRASLALQYDVAPFTLGVATTYDYYLRETEGFLGEVGVLPWVRHSTAKWGYTDLYYRMRDRNFHGIHFGVDVEEFRGGMNHAAGIAHTLPLGSGAGYTSVGFRFDHDHADRSDGRPFDYNGYLLDFELGWALPAGIDAVTGYAYMYEDYASESDGREDNVHHANVLLRKPLSDWLALRAEFRATINDSNEELYEYERYIGTIGLDASY